MNKQNVIAMTLWRYRTLIHFLLPCSKYPWTINRTLRLAFKPLRCNANASPVTRLFFSAPHKRIEKKKITLKKKNWKMILFCFFFFLICYVASGPVVSSEKTKSGLNRFRWFRKIVDGPDGWCPRSSDAKTAIRFVASYFFFFYRFCYKYHQRHNAIQL